MILLVWFFYFMILWSLFSNKNKDKFVAIKRSSYNYDWCYNNNNNNNMNNIKDAFSYYFLLHILLIYWFTYFGWVNILFALGFKIWRHYESIFFNPLSHKFTKREILKGGKNHTMAFVLSGSNELDSVGVSILIIFYFSHPSIHSQSRCPKVALPRLQSDSQGGWSRKTAGQWRDSQRCWTEDRWGSASDFPPLPEEQCSAHSCNPAWCASLRETKLNCAQLSCTRSIPWLSELYGL